MEVNMKKFLFLIALVISTGITVFAQEGMWLLSQIDQLGLKEKGLEIETSDIYSPDNPSLHQAIVQLGGGTASFVSPEGLLITNHHVAYTGLQRASSVDADYLADGFVAKTKKEEINAPGYEARLLQEMKDVTDEVIKAGKGIEDLTERDEKINEKIAEIEEKMTKGKDDFDAYVAEMYNGKQYILFVYKVFKDIRIVYAPPSSIGKYGGDIDNWMWPRHTGDFSFMRVYVRPDGTGAEFSEDNVPYKPEVWLKVATEDLDEGDFTFIVGFPGATTRYRTSNSAGWNLKYNYPFSIQNFGEIIDLMDKLTKNDPEGKLKVASLRSGLANAMKNYEGKVEGMKKTNFVQKKKDFEKEFMNWVNADPERKEKYGNILNDIAAEYKVIEKTKDRDNVIGILQGLGSTQLNVAARIYNVAKELEKPQDERNPGFNEKTVERAKNTLQYSYANYYEPVDKAMLKRVLKMVDELPSGQRIEELEYIFNSGVSIEQWVDDAFENSKLDDLDYARSLFGKSSKELETLNDPFIDMVARMYDFNEAYGETYQAFAANVTELRKQYIDALYEWKGKNLYPDANGTIRFTWGPVKGYSPEDAVWYRPFTSLSGVIAKNTGEDPFDVPEGLIQLYEEQEYGKWVDPDLDDVPVAFTHQGDITGGNSGSPAMNAKGEIIGVVFDGNYEAMISDWQYDHDLQRVISVDIRYCLFVTEKFGNAGFILDEMDVPRGGQSMK
jgi:hypothetical protein